MTELWQDGSYYDTRKSSTDNTHVPINWPLVQSSGIARMTIRATWATYPTFGKSVCLLDNQFLANYKDAEVANLFDQQVWYHLYNGKKNIQEQAEFYINNVPVTYRPMIDLELSAYKGCMDDVRKFWLDPVEAYYKTIPILYASPSWITTWCTPSQTWLRRYPLLIAHYSTPAPLIPLPFFPGDELGWQFTDRAWAPAYGIANGNKGASIYRVYPERLP